jgi:metal-dependent hydrolase (beta-lactamase superfamily II)
MSIDLFCYQAECGDAIHIRYTGNDGNPHNIFLDSGFERTYRNILQQEIECLIRNEESIDLWVVSHIHDDHIGGVIKYIKSVENNEIKDITKYWFYNSPHNYSAVLYKETNIISLPTSIAQGDKLYNFLYLNNMLPKQDITTDLGIQDFFGMKIRILSPNTSIIKELRNKYQTGIPFEENEMNVISHATSTIGYDYHKRMNNFNLEEFKEDDSLENKSSISLLLEYQDKKILWLADSHPSVVIDSLVQNGYSNKQPLICDYIILSHHASKGNNSSLFFDMVKCNKYIVSSNGENKYCLPNKEVFARIIRNKHRDLSELYTFYFIYDTSNLKTIFKSDDNDIYDSLNFNVVYNKYHFII